MSNNIESTMLKKWKALSWSCVRGHHVYQRTWTPTLGEELQCIRESTNNKDPMLWRGLSGGEYWLLVPFFCATYSYSSEALFAAPSASRQLKLTCQSHAHAQLYSLGVESSMAQKYWRILNLAVYGHTAKPPNLIPRQILWLYGIFRPFAA